MWRGGFAFAGLSLGIVLFGGQSQQILPHRIAKEKCVRARHVVDCDTIGKEANDEEKQRKWKAGHRNRVMG